jgi:preprotein translocase subunit SecG
VQTLITILHIIICIVLILVVLLQTGKGASMGAVFGGSSQTVFGSSGPGSFLSRMTTVIAIVFMLTSFGLTYMVSQKSPSLMEGSVKKAAQQTAPISKPGAPAPAAAPAAQQPAAAQTTK